MKPLLQKDNKIIFFVQSDAKTENSNGISKILLNLITGLKGDDFKFLIFGEPVQDSIYAKHGEVIYFNQNHSVYNYVYHKFFYVTDAHKELLLSNYNYGDTVLVFGSFANIKLITLLPRARTKICLIDSSARYYYKLKIKHIVKRILARTFMLMLEMCYEISLRMRGYHISYVSSKDRDFLPIFRKKCVVIENGVVQHNYRKKNTPVLINRLVFVGNLDYAPNRQAVHFIAQYLCPALPTFQFYIIGDATQNFDRDYDEQHNLVFTGYIEDLTQYLNEHAIFISPIFSGTGLQNKILDAFAHNVPVIASSFSTSGITCSPGVHYLSAETVDEFLGAITALTMATAQRQRQKLSHNARQLISEQYNWDSVIKKYEKFISHE